MPKYCFVVLEVVKAWVDTAVEAPRTIRHRGYGKFAVPGKTLTLRSKMR